MITMTVVVFVLVIFACFCVCLLIGASEDNRGLNQYVDELLRKISGLTNGQAAMEKRLTEQAKLASVAAVDTATLKHLYRGLLSKPLAGGSLASGDKLLLWHKPKPRFEAGAKVFYSGKPAEVVRYDEFGRPHVNVPALGVTVPALDSLLTEQGGEKSVEDSAAVDEDPEPADSKPQSVGTSLCSA